MPMVNRALFLTEKYCDADPSSGPANVDSLVFGPVMSSGLVGEMKRFYFDVLAKQLGRGEMMNLLVEDCEVFRPDLIIYTPLGGLLGYQLNPLDLVPGAPELGAWLRAKGIKVYRHLWDTIARDEEVRRRHIASGDFVGDVASNADRFGKDPRIIQVYSCWDPKDYYDKQMRRDIDVCFVGSVDPTGEKWLERTLHINFLRQNGINVVVRGGQRGDRISRQEYVDILNRSKISLNFSIDIRHGTSQIKGRVFEAMACGAMLIEDNGDQTCRFFEPGVDFAMFDCGGHGKQVRSDDLLAKVKHYLTHEGERLKIARSGWEKVTSIYNAKNMWGYVFHKMGFYLPDALLKDRNFQEHDRAMSQIRKGSYAWRTDESSVLIS